MGKRTTLADALHQAGRLDEAEALFEEAERMQEERQPASRCSIPWGATATATCSSARVRTRGSASGLSRQSVADKQDSNSS